MIDSDKSVQYQGDQMFRQAGEKETHIQLYNGPKICKFMEMEQICKWKACQPFSATSK